MAKLKFQKDVEIRNRKATFQYFLHQTYTAGMVLLGTEVRSVRLGQASMNDAYCVIEGGEVYIRNLHIAEYKMGTDNNHEPLRKRKLLLKSEEIRKIERKIKEKGHTLIPVRLFISDRGFVKMDVAVASGKKSFDKRDSIKQKDNKRAMDRAKKWRD